MGAVELARAEKVDFLLAVGGGSVLDGSKFIAAAAHYDPARDPWHILETVGGEVASHSLGSVLTLPAFRLRDEHGRRHHPQEHRGQAALLLALRDAALRRARPVLTYTCPPVRWPMGWWMPSSIPWSSTSTYPVDAKVQDRFAEGLLLTLAEEGPKALVEPENHDVRANIMWSATLALNG